MPAARMHGRAAGQGRQTPVRALERPGGRSGMPLTFHVDVVSAERLLYSGTAQRVVVPGVAGELGILARHAPLLAQLRPGRLRVLTAAGDEQSFFVSGGFVEVQPQQLTVLADTAVRSDALDTAAAAAARARAEQELRAAVRRQDYERLKAEIKMYTLLLQQLQEARVRRK